MIKWTGTDTAKRVKWEAEAKTYKELAEKLADYVERTHHREKKKF